jgi:hypothetical protein
MQVVFETPDAGEAQLLQHFLANYGIAIHIQGTLLSGAAGELPVGMPLRLWSDDLSAAKARRLIEDYRTAVPLTQNEETDWSPPIE